MLSLGMDIGTSTVKLVLLRDGAMAKQWMAVHHGRPFACLKKGLSALELDADTPFSLCVTPKLCWNKLPIFPLLGISRLSSRVCARLFRRLVRSLKLAVRARDSSRICRAVHFSFQSTNTARAVQVRSLKTRCPVWAASWRITLRW